MKLESSKSRLNYQKKKQIKGKSEKFASVFIKNKANLKNIKIAISSFETGKYEISPAGSGEKSNPSKPNTNPIPERPKMNLRNAITMNYKKFILPAVTNTNPIQTQNKAI